MSLFCPDCRSTYQDHTLRVCPNDGTRLYVMDSTSSDDPLISATIDGRFQIERSIGVGGMGTVYRAKQLSVGRDVAVKVLRAELSGKEVALERFFREAKTISQLTHPNIVRLIDFGQDREFDVLYLVMELVAGTNLGDLLRQGRLRVALALEIAYQVCGALTEPHAAGVIHRDLKPDNLLLMPVSDGTVQTKVLDFGIARALETNETTLTATGMICGTPAYMAPEQAQNEDLDPRTDLYALGVILYEMLSGWPPFSGTSSLQIMLKHIQEMPVRLRELLPPATLPEEVEQLVYELMDKDRDKRPDSAREVRDRIDALRREFDFGHVRVDHSDEIEEFVLRKLPRGKDGKSGPTEVLRRETGMEEMLTGHQTGAPPALERHTDADTVDEMDHHTTFPFTPDERGEIRADAKVKISTKGGAQQAWTPGDQPALDNLKHTDKNFAGGDAVDAFGATVADTNTPSPDASHHGGDSGVRKTMVESHVDSEELTPKGPSTAENAMAVAPRSDVRTADTSDSRRAVTAPANPGVSMPLLLAAAMTLFVVGAAVMVILELREISSQDDQANVAATTATTATADTSPKGPPAEARDQAMVLAASRGAHAVSMGREVASEVDQLDAEKTTQKNGSTSSSGKSAHKSTGTTAKKSGGASTTKKDPGSESSKSGSGSGSGSSEPSLLDKKLKGLRDDG